MQLELSQPGRRTDPGKRISHLGTVDLDPDLALFGSQFILDPDFPYGEDLLQFIWEQQLFDQNALCTTDGRSVEVLEPGRIQRNSGPDLAGAKVRIDGQLWAGNVEVHLRSSEWNEHKHQYDPAYENVVLHVVFIHDSEIQTLGGITLPTLELFTRIPVGDIRQHYALMRGNGFVPCASQLALVDEEVSGPWLELLLVERLERKTIEVERLYHQLDMDPSATLYHMLARAFGLKVNAEPFGMLANALPLRVLQKYVDDPLRTEALLFGQAGLLGTELIDEHPRRMRAEHALLAGLHGLRPAPAAAWKFGRMRPANFPTVRIAQFAQLLFVCHGNVSDLLGTGQVADLRRTMSVTASAYWNDHYILDKCAELRPKRLGSAGADHLILNALIPVMFAMGHVQGRPELRKRAVDLLSQLPAENNNILRAWSRIGLKADQAGRGQALLELKDRYCDHRSCLSCGIGNHLLKRIV